MMFSLLTFSKVYNLLLVRISAQVFRAELLKINDTGLLVWGWGRGRERPIKLPEQR